MEMSGYQETFSDNNSVRYLVTDNGKEENSYANRNYVANGTEDTTVEQRTQPPQNTDRRDYEHWYETKKWLLLFFVAAVVIITGMFVATVIMATASVNDEDGKNQQINTLQENLENNLTSIFDNVDGTGQQIKTLRENLEKNLTSIIDDVYNKDQQTKKILENLEKNLTSLTNKVDDKDQQLKTLQKNLEKNLTRMVEDDYAKDQQTKNIIENLQRNLTSLTDKVDLLLLLNMSRIIDKTIDGWYLASDGLNYKYFPERVNYATAKSRCEDVEGMLLTKGLRNASVFREMEDDLLPSTSMQTRTWIGFHEKEEGDWHWLDGGATNTEVVSWHEGEPNNYNGQNEACANILRIDQSKAEINDELCSHTASFVCER